jgi:hypothetical protein
MPAGPGPGTRVRGLDSPDPVAAAEPADGAWHGSGAAPALSGTIVHLEEAQEPPDPHVMRGVLLVFYSLPLLIMGLAIILAGSICLALLRVGRSGRGGLLTTAVLWFAGRRSRERTIPVRISRVRTGGDQPSEAHLRGYLTTGSIARGDQVQLWGRWINGTLQVRRGYNVRTGSAVILNDGTFGVSHMGLVVADTLVWLFILWSALAAR